MSEHPESEKVASLKALAVVATLKGDPTPREFDLFMRCMHSFQPLPPGWTTERLLATTAPIESLLQQIRTPELQQQVYRSARAILQTKGIAPAEASILQAMETHFGFSPEMAQALAKQPLTFTANGDLMNSPLDGITSLIQREGEVRRMIFDYALGAAIVGLIPITGGGSLEVKLLVVLLLILKMIWDIRNLWGQPRGQDVLAIAGNAFGFLGAVIAGLLAWATMIGLSVVIPYVGAFAKAAGFATATWIAGQSTNQFYTSQKRPDLKALKRAFPNLIPTKE